MRSRFVSQFTRLFAYALRMAPGWSNWLTAVCFHCAAASAFSHPSSSIVVNEQGEVFFIHTGRGVGKIDAQGKLTYIHKNSGGHWHLTWNGDFLR